MGSIYRRGGVYWIKYRRAGRPYRESTHSDKVTEAKRLLALREGQIVEGRFPGLHIERIRFEELANDYVKEYRVNGRRSLDEAERYAKYLREAFEGLRVVEVTSGRIMEYIDKRRRLGRSNGTINRELGALRRMFNLGARQHPPKVHHMPAIPHLKENNVRTGFFEHDEFLALRGALPDHQKIPLSIAYWTGMRLGEVINLRWEQVDLKREVLRLEPGTTKNGEGRVVPLMGDLAMVLARWQEKTLAKWPACQLVCHYKGKQLERLTRGWRTACKRIGLKGKLFHDLRRTAVRNMVRAGISERVAMQISGHKTRSVFDRYDIVSERDLFDAADRLRSYFHVLPATVSHDTLRAQS